MMGIDDIDKLELEGQLNAEVRRGSKERDASDSTEGSKQANDVRTRKTSVFDKIKMASGFYPTPSRNVLRGSSSRSQEPLKLTALEKLSFMLEWNNIRLPGGVDEVVSPQLPLVVGDLKMGCLVCVTRKEVPTPTGRGTFTPWKLVFRLELENVPEVMSAYCKISLFDEAGQEVERVDGSMWQVDSPNQRMLALDVGIPASSDRSSHVEVIGIQCTLQLVNLSTCEKEPNILASMINVDSLKDVTLVAEGKEYRAHKAVLAAASSVFKEKFETRSKEKISRIDIDDASPDAVDAMLKYVYLSFIPGSPDLALNLLKLADTYKMEELKLRCGNILESSLSTSNVLDVLALSDSYSCEHLKTCAIQYCTTHSKHVVGTPAWTVFAKKHPQLLMKAYEHLAHHLGHQS